MEIFIVIVLLVLTLIGAVLCYRSDGSEIETVRGERDEARRKIAEINVKLLTLDARADELGKIASDQAAEILDLVEERDQARTDAKRAAEELELVGSALEGQTLLTSEAAANCERAEKELAELRAVAYVRVGRTWARVVEKAAKDRSG